MRIISSLVLGSLSWPSFAGTAVSVSHWWTSKSESAAINVVKKDFIGKGYEWKDLSTEGGGGGNMIEKLGTMVASGNAPDAVQMLMGPRVWEWAEKKNLLDLDDLARKDQWPSLVPQIISETSIYKGKYVGVPTLIHRINWMFANQKAFKDAGVPFPKSWEDLFAAADKLKAKGYVPVAISTEAWQISTLFESVVLSVGGKELRTKALVQQNPDALGSEKIIKAFDIMRKISEISDTEKDGRSWDAATKMVIGTENQKAAIQFMGDWAKGEFPKKSFDSGKYICQPTFGTGDAFISHVDTFIMFKSKDMAVEKAQQELAKSFMSPRVQEQFSLEKGSIPSILKDKKLNMAVFDKCAKLGIAQFNAAESKAAVLPSFTFDNVGKPDVIEEMKNIVATHFNDKSIPSNVAATKLAKAAQASSMEKMVH